MVGDLRFAQLLRSSTADPIGNPARTSDRHARPTAAENGSLPAGCGRSDVHAIGMFRSETMRIVVHTCGVVGSTEPARLFAPRVTFGFVGVGLCEVTRGRRQVSVGVNEVAVVGSAEEYGVRHLACRGRHCATVVDLASEVLEEVDAPQAARAALASGAISRPPAAHRLLASLASELRIRAQPEVVEELVLELIGAVLAGGHVRPSGSSPEHRRITARARELLAERYCEVLGLEEVALAARCSTFHLCRVFKSQLGMPVYRYLHRLRVSAAIDRLVEGENDLNRLAMDLGFSSHSHFTRIFRREVGVTPSEARCSFGPASRRSGRRLRSPVGPRAVG